MLTLTERLIADRHVQVNLTLPLTAEERRRSRKQFTTAEGVTVKLNLARGTVLQHGDILAGEDVSAGTSQTTKQLVRVIAKPEPTIAVTARTPLDLLRAAYHLGNRHIPLEIALDRLRLEPDPVLVDMLQQMGLHAIEEIAPFQPEAGAYASQAQHADSHHHSHA
ncbi:urease accessory protein UreE [Pseudanabaena sp. PCC 6802]|uniref:urease accessory protein UreE n=1 Tax=Pseudanabaena sp. PCC 6802 TaxID=118173 RepID=UPI00034CF7DF|nr:urease accessory protein UreE [Pseudanabaena sp. PCC 6802]